VATTVLVLALYLLAMLPVVLLNLVPVVGSAAASAVGTVVSTFFLTLEYADFAMARRGYGLTDRLRLLRRHLPTTLGFGLGTALLLYVPVLNLLGMPVAVVGGTVVAVALDETR
jgi:CysZ protein